MKEAILDIITAAFAEWASRAQFCCREGCSSCCTRSVTLTALEGRRILRHCREHKGRTWLAGKLTPLLPTAPALRTTNEYVGAVLDGCGDHQDEAESREQCPFLENNRCSIYPVRPFGCRCFHSTTPCRDRNAATVSEAHLFGSLAVMQIIEHLGQFDHWGNMIDVLVVLLDSPRYGDPAASFNNHELLHHGRTHVRQAQPLPGFFLPQEVQEHITPLLHAILNSRLEAKSVEQILNGR